MPEIKKTYRAHGKLLLTAEYLVLHGANAIALPLKYGQQMEVLESDQHDVLSWQAFSPEGCWFFGEFQLPELEIRSSSNHEKAITLQNVLKTIREMNSEFRFENGLDIHTTIDFHSEWGFGSSSTMIANLASWSGVDPYELNERLFHGSGFDIACAAADGPVLYCRKERAKDIQLDYSFIDQLYFVYSGSKKSTHSEVRRFLSDTTVSDLQLEKVNRLTDQIAGAKSLDEFQILLEKHETLVGELLGTEPIQQKYFPDFPGKMKSLGAWGGDFYLAAANKDRASILQYFKEKGLQVVFPWKDLILNNR
ncbi:MAG TPA: GYDIA family GHMP kinase [Sunxiuqinia sp.]|nr:GYDIA family GHMP kinase [Sunxiuqinia sp.]